MDPLTQGLLGAAAAQALLGKRLGRRAWLLGAAGGMLPDLDVLIRSQADPLLAIEHHRGFTHALVFIPVGGAVASLPWLASRSGRARWKPILGAATAGYATHGLLDACTTYGTQLFWPFSSYRVAWNCISIVDPVFTLALLVGVVAAAVLRARWPALAALAFCLAYLGLGVLQRERAQQVQQAVAALRQHEPVRAAVFPTLANLLVWRSLYQAGDTLYADRIRVPWFDPPQYTEGNTVAALQERDLRPELLRDERVRRDFRRFAWFSSGWVARAPHAPDVIGDARYSLRTDSFLPIWGVRFHPGAPVPTEWVDRTGDRDVRPADLWNEITGRRADYRPLPAPAPDAAPP